MTDTATMLKMMEIMKLKMGMKLSCVEHLADLLARNYNKCTKTYLAGPYRHETGCDFRKGRDIVIRNAREMVDHECTTVKDDDRWQEINYTITDPRNDKQLLRKRITSPSGSTYLLGPVVYTEMHTAEVGVEYKLQAGDGPDFPPCPTYANPEPIPVDKNL